MPIRRRPELHSESDSARLKRQAREMWNGPILNAFHLNAWHNNEKDKAIYEKRGKLVSPKKVSKT